MKKLFGYLFGLSLFVFVGTVFAQDLTLTSVGVLSTVGVDYSNIEYTGTIPYFEGLATPSSQVLIKIKTSTDATVAASPSGKWSFTPGVLDKGNSSVTITSGGQTLAFVINFNATPAAEVTPATVADELPEAGVWEYYLPALGGGLLVLYLGRYIKQRMSVWEGKKGN